MKTETVSAIMTMAQADASMSKEPFDALAEICRGRGTIRRKRIGFRSVEKFCANRRDGPSAPSLFIDMSEITSIRLSCRKGQYDERKIQRLLNNGIEENS